MPERSRVSTLELFFDLVFVFTITQVALIVEHRPTWASAAQALAELAVICWMYGGFSWLTNMLGSESPRQRIVLLLGMAAFFLVSLAVPRAFDADGVAFGYAYLVLNVVHLAGFLIGDVPNVATAMRRVGAVNLAAASLVIVAGYVGAPWHWPLWVAALSVQWAVGLLNRQASAFELGADHFAERHGLMIIIVLGESIVSVALAAQSLTVTASLAVGVLCGLAASAAMWWCYFARDDVRAADAFAVSPVSGRGRLALIAYDMPHVLMMGGIIAVAAGSRLSLPHLTRPTTTAAAVLLAGGTSLYLLSLVLFRVALRFATPLPRAVGAVLVLALIPLGRYAGGAQQLAATAVLLAAMLAVERRFDVSTPARADADETHPAG